jgi:hypothetical protein
MGRNMKSPKKSLVQLLTESPLVGSSVKFERIRDLYSGETEKLLSEAMTRGNFPNRDEAIKAALQAYLAQQPTPTRTTR